jgi:hypothetical protein
VSQGHLAQFFKKYKQTEIKTLPNSTLRENGYCCFDIYIVKVFLFLWQYTMFCCVLGGFLGVRVLLGFWTKGPVLI